MNLEIGNSHEHSPTDAVGLSAVSRKLAKSSGCGLCDAFNERDFHDRAIRDSVVIRTEYRARAGVHFGAFDQRLNPAHRCTVWEDFFDGRIHVRAWCGIRDGRLVAAMVLKCRASSWVARFFPRTDKNYTTGADRV